MQRPVHLLFHSTGSLDTRPSTLDLPHSTL